MKRALAVMSILVILAATACGAASTAPKHASSSRKLRSTSGSTTPQVELLNQIVASVQPTEISSETIGQPPTYFEGGPNSWVTFAIPAGDVKANLLANWQAALIAGTFHDLSQTQQLPTVAGWTTPGAASAVGAPDHPAMTATPSQQDIASDLENVGLTPASIDIQSPGEGAAVVVTATTPDAATFLSENPSPAAAVFGDLNTYAGTFLEIDDAQGVAYVAAYASAAGRGELWMRPALQGATATPVF
jgi:hypothetical protein